MAAAALALLVADAAPGQAPQTPQAETITVMMSNFQFDPETITIQSGKPYVLHLVNAASGGHSFTAPEFFAAASIAPADAAKLKSGKLDLKGGTAADLHFTIDKPGRYELHCSHFLHSSFGMTGEIVVE